jgi:hypothetical protein
VVDPDERAWGGASSDEHDRQKWGQLR